MNATTPMDNNDPFAVLGVSANASESEIRRQYLHLVKLNPPEQDAEKFRTIQRAYESARDPLVLAERLLNNSRNLTDWNDLLDEQQKNPPQLNVSTLLALGNRHEDGTGNSLDE